MSLARVFVILPMRPRIGKAEQRQAGLAQAEFVRALQWRNSPFAPQQDMVGSTASGPLASGLPTRGGGRMIRPLLPRPPEIA
jgi:hypothetical protein